MKIIAKIALMLVMLLCTTAVQAQTVQNSSHSTIGYVKDGTVYNSSHSTMGYIRNDGTVQNSSHSTMGYIRNDGTIQNSSHSTIGYAKGVSQQHAAALLFFFGMIR